MSDATSVACAVIGFIVCAFLFFDARRNASASRHEQRGRRARFELDEKATGHLDELVALSLRESRLETVQHALATYHFLQEELVAGSSIEVQRRDDGVLELISERHRGRAASCTGGKRCSQG